MASHNSTFSIYIYCRLLPKRKYVWDQWMRKSKALNVSDSSGEKNMLGCDNLKEISSVSSIQRWQRGSRQKQMHSSAIYKGYCIKSMLKCNKTQKWCQPATNFFSKFLLLQFSNMLLISFFYCMFLSFLVPDFGLCVASVVFIFVIIALFVFSQEPLLPLFCNSVALVWKWKSKITGGNENREHGTCVLGLVVCRNRCWKAGKKRHIFVIK